MADQWNDAGYALVLVDARGSGASSGQRPVEWSDAEVADLGEVTEWITSQPWSDGSVGAVGISYSGNTAELSTIPAHPALRAVAPLYSDFDPQFFLTMPGGVYNRGFVEAWNAANQALDANDICALEDVDGLGCWWLKLAVPGVKPVDADTDGGLLRDAVAGHETLDLAAALEAMSYRDDTLPDGVSIGDVSPYGRLEAIEAAGVPMLVRAGWLDAATADGALSRYLSSDMAQELVIGAWNHGGEDDVDPFQPRWTFPDPTFDQQFADLVAFFDRHLGEPATSVPAKSIRYYTMNEGRWRTTATWPPPEMETQRWYLGADQSLTDSPPHSGGGGRLRRQRFRLERRHHPMADQPHRWRRVLPGSRRRGRPPPDLHRRAARGRPADHGNAGGVASPLLHAPDGALHVYLEDVAPDGRVTYLTEGILRLIHGVSDDAVLPYEHPGPPRTFPSRRCRAAHARRGGSRRDAAVRHVGAARGRTSAAHRHRRTRRIDLCPIPRGRSAGPDRRHSPASPSFLELPVATE